MTIIEVPEKKTRTDSVSSTPQVEWKKELIEKLEHHTDEAEEWGYIAMMPVWLIKIPLFLIASLILLFATLFAVYIDPKGMKGGSMHFFYHLWLKSLGIWIWRKGELNNDGSIKIGAPVTVSNHISNIDGFVLVKEMMLPRIVSKIEVKSIPIIKTWFQLSNPIYIDRQDKDSKKTLIQDMVDHCEQWNEGDSSLLIFPEGKTNNGNTVGPFMKGAFIAGKPIQPIVVMYTGGWKPYNPKYWKRMNGEVTRYGDMDWGLGFLGCAYIPITITTLPVYHPNEEEKKDPELYADNVYEIIRQQYDKDRAAWLDECKRRREKWGFLAEPSTLFSFLRRGARQKQNKE